MTKAAIFKNNTSQAVRLPKDVAFPEGTEKVEVLVEGNKRILVPAENSWDDWFNSLGVADFLDDRDQADQERELF